MGTVWRAEDELLGRHVAVKRLRVPHGMDEEELATLCERTRREARSAARISHPNVVVVHDVVEDDGMPCIVMEHVPSRTLGEVLADGTLAPGEAARVGRGMIAALRAAHAAGVLHRDVKPGNVLLGHDGRVVLTDFGIARLAGNSTLTKTGEMVGSVDYIAPERVRGAGPGPAADLWALGATLYEAVEGRPPFRRDTAVETAYAIAVDPLDPPRHAGPLTRLIETLLTRDPALRPPAELVEQILEDAGAAGAAGAAAPGPAAGAGATGPAAGVAVPPVPASGVFPAPDRAGAPGRAASAGRAATGSAGCPGALPAPGPDAPVGALEAMRAPASSWTPAEAGESPAAGAASPSAPVSGTAPAAVRPDPQAWPGPAGATTRVADAPGLACSAAPGPGPETTPGSAGATTRVDGVPDAARGAAPEAGPEAAPGSAEATTRAARAPGAVSGTGPGAAPEASSGSAGAAVHPPGAPGAARGAVPGPGAATAWASAPGAVPEAVPGSTGTATRAAGTPDVARGSAPGPGPGTDRASALGTGPDVVSGPGGATATGSEAPTAAVPAGGRRGRARRWAVAGGTLGVLLAAVVAYLLVPGGDADDDAAPAPRRTPGSAGPPQPVVPRGHHWVEEKRLGVALPVPDGWRRQEKSAVEVDYIDPTGRVDLKINVLDLAGPDPLRHWEDVEREVRRKLTGYRRLRMQETSYRGGPAAVWEFSFTGRARQYRAIDLGFGRAGGDEYAVYLSAPAEQWDRHRPVFDAVRDGLRVTGRGRG
ncbi:protein kinase [Streptomyces sp. AV19]|uniref:serine/threonine-protein kinase n=1 Tax=Streptomyces sp. AV19 TaxID=2793068 RepID=UPI0035ABBC69